ETEAAPLPIPVQGSHAEAAPSSVPAPSQATSAFVRLPASPHYSLLREAGATAATAGLATPSGARHTFTRVFERSASCHHMYEACCSDLVESVYQTRTSALLLGLNGADGATDAVMGFAGVPSSVDSAGFLLRAAVHLLDACSGPEGGTNPWQLGCRIVSARSGSLTDLLAAQRPLGKPGQAALAPIASLKDLLSILRGGILASSNLDEPGLVLASLVLAPPDKACSPFGVHFLSVSSSSLARAPSAGHRDVSPLRALLKAAGLPGGALPVDIEAAAPAVCIACLPSEVADAECMLAAMNWLGLEERLYDSTVAPLVEEMLEGFNCTIFAYGQTGTGKTYTMTGGDLAQGSAEMTDSAGVIPRAIHQVFSYLESLGAQEFTVKASYLELYNEEVTDLLALGSEPPKVRILEDRTGVVLNGLEEAQVRSASDIFSLLDQGTAKRRTAETLLNKQSSRSHTVFVITVSVREILAEGEEVIRVGKLYLVDLAGSENITRSGAVEQRAKEAGNINKSLLTLGRVITALVEGQGHVPYRDSKLTRLLRDSLGGRTKTCIIATIAPTVQCQEETLSTLEYAHRAKNIKNKPEINQKISKTTHLKEMNVEIEKLKLMLNATREKNGVYIPTAQYDEECEERKFLNGRVLELEEAAEASGAQHEAEKAELAAAAESQRQVLEQRLEEVEAAAAVLRGELEEAQVRIEERDHLILCQQRHEAALADHASRLTTELTAAAADLALLFTRVEAKQALEDGNWEVVSGLRARLQERVATARTALEAGTARAAQATQEAGRMWGEEAARRAMRRERLAADEAE
ncbi:hypothetical protein APUTEX25_004583, partial [Auxenochlorella protothecoides]